jgi:tRNA(adenine34) deaminase
MAQSDRPTHDTALVLLQDIAREALEMLELTDERFMELALQQARAASAVDEVPVGAILVLDGAIIARAHNLTHTRRDPTAHAELLCVSQAARELGLLRLCGATLYSTVEPCFMCAGALLQARVERVVWGVRDPKFGGAVSLGQVLSDPRANHRAEIREGVCADEARGLLQEFFRKKRGERT